MRSIESYRREEAKLRARHTEQTNAGKWQEAQTTRDKIIMVLNAIKSLEDAADQVIDRPPKEP